MGFPAQMHAVRRVNPCPMARPLLAQRNRSSLAGQNLCVTPTLQDQVRTALFSARCEFLKPR